jgi:uncharacterized protein (DUF362 family)
MSAEKSGDTMRHFNKMSRREFITSLTIGCLAASGLPGWQTGAAASECFSVYDPASDPGSAALVNRILRTNKRLMEEDGTARVVAVAIPPEHITSAERTEETIRSAARNFMTHFPHSPDSPYVRSRKEGTLSQLSVLIKPNLAGFDAPSELDYKCTHPAFVEGIIDALVEMGISPCNIIIAEGARYGLVKVMIGTLDASGYLDLIGRRGVKFLDLNAYEKAFHPPFQNLLKEANVNEESYSTSLSWVLMEPSENGEASTFYQAMGDARAPVLPRQYLEILDRGWVLNVPKLKVHRLAVASGAVKNLMGIVGFQCPRRYGPPHLQKDFVHSDFQFGQSPHQFRKVLLQASQILSDVYLAARPHLTIYDGILTAGGNGLSVVYPIHAPQIIGSENSLFADFGAASALGFLGNTHLKKLLGLDGPPFLLTPLSRFYPDREITLERDGRKVSSLALTSKPYYVMLAFKSGEKDYTPMGEAPGRKSLQVNTDELRTPFHRLLKAVVISDKTAVLSSPSEDAAEIAVLKKGEFIFLRGTDKINVRYLSDGLASSSPKTGASLTQDMMWLFIDRGGDGVCTGWIGGGEVKLIK